MNNCLVFSALAMFATACSATSPAVRPIGEGGGSGGSGSSINGPQETPVAAGAVGASCSAANQCESGVCEGPCGAGRCVENNRMCTMDVAEYCGCDGVTFTSSGSCAGRLYSAKAACTAAAAKPAPGSVADGGKCDTATDCASGVCEGQGCGAFEGVCAPKLRGCTRDIRSYCGCDGKTFQASGSCPGARFTNKGGC